MRFNTLINNQKCLQWGLNANQGALFDLLNQLSNWANPVIIDGKVYYHISRNKIIDELPLFYTKPDTVYRHFKKLVDLDLVIHLKDGKKDLITITSKGKTWNQIRNSEMNPTKIGNESENNSEMNPTYNNTSINNNTSNNIIVQKDVKSDKEIAFNNFYSQYPRKQGKDPAKKAFLKLKVEEIQAALDVVGVYPFSKDKQYIPLPSTWINQKRWKDEFEAKKPAFTQFQDDQAPF